MNISELLNKNKTLIVTVIVFVAALWVYSSFVKPTLTTPTNTSTREVGSDILALYASLQSVTLDQSLFSSPLYRNLVDFSTPLASQPVGRTNPFGTIGAE